MSGSWKRQTRSSRAAPSTSRGDWRALISLAVEAVGEVEGERPVPDLKLMTLGSRVRRVEFGTLEREAGSTTADTARALVRLLEPFSGAATPMATRREMIPAVRAVASLLEDRLHAAAARDFQRAHAGRPEVWR